MAKAGRDSPRDQVLTLLRPHLRAVGIFSIFVNILVLTTPIYLMQVYNRILPSASYASLAVLSIGTVVALVCFALLDSVRGRILQRAGITFQKVFAPKVLTGLVDRARSPQRVLQAQPLRDIETVRQFLASGATTAFMDAPWVIFFLIALLLLHPWFLVVGLVGMLIMLGVTWSTERATRDKLRESAVAQIQALEFAQGSLRNADAVRAMGMGPALLERWARGMARSESKSLEASDAESRYAAATRFFRLIIQIAGIGVGALLVMSGKTSAGAIFASSTLMARALQPVEQIVGSWKLFVQARDSWSRIEELLKTMPAEAEASRIWLPDPKGALAVKDVRFIPAPGMTHTLLGVSFELAPGESLGIIGPTGAGKSTLTRILTGVWPPLGGEVRLDGADLRHWNPKQLGEAVGYMPQDVELFAGTVAENIARMNTVDDEMVVAAARRAGAHEIILQLPNGYETQIGQSGAVLSGGQRQRIALARALYGSPKFVVLDEPNANLDSAGDSALRTALDHLKADGVTTIVVSHRPQTIAAVDKMLVLRDGRVDMFGEREDVMKKLTRPVSSAPVQGAGIVTSTAVRQAAGDEA